MAQCFSVPARALCHISLPVIVVFMLISFVIRYFEVILNIVNGVILDICQRLYHVIYYLILLCLLCKLASRVYGTKIR